MPNKLPEDIIRYIWALYYSNHCLKELNNTVEKLSVFDSNNILGRGMLLCDILTMTDRLLLRSDVYKDFTDIYVLYGHLVQDMIADEFRYDNIYTYDYEYAYTT